jgi:cob(I)alamin adenosyltransferase
MSKRPDRHRPPDAPGMVHVYTGDGKGKTTCAVGLATRAAGAGLRVWMLQFDKNFEDAERCNERAALEKLGVTLIATGCNRLLDNGRFRFKNLDSDLEEARRGLTLAR